MNHIPFEPQPVLILAGGTGGHIFPGIAVARMLHAQAVPVLWLGADGGMETRLVPAEGIAIETINVRAVRGKGVLRLLLSPFMVARAVLQSLAILRRHRPRAVVSFGGFAAGPGAIAAWLLKTPLLVHEQNRAPGMTNRILVRIARQVLCGFPDSFPGRATQWLGNPVRAPLTMLPEPAKRMREHDAAMRILVLGGSQGAQALNQALPLALARLGTAVPYQVRHQCGANQHDATRTGYARMQVLASIEPFIDDMAAAYMWADLVICRSGALTLAELCAVGVASVLVPFPHAVDDHQARNAEFLSEHAAAVLVPQSPDLARHLAAEILRLHRDRVTLLAMAQAARALAQPRAAEQVAEAIIAEALA
ncbi:MAG: undecaprenyldiphospho-muramoylpentapeptide beta-N-acetylglucosaminyltransferase [Gammaproteobacteria bacterium HGW-Gammaproteobacteria-4]|jgi:UDP-N-acetylglucosamine--N-acetylmuramyl-(pentapeptide) pyrophosphoryl-undecaprenol N-acetylglucosamine transferase|nr:MAG: undecaprenyldiphospho-muramoylpentapeptide beta-N-acetylglucosaminyltransferase [Gammaproteobacteria bacterium HGW-Gammaproteobacteria-4]